MSVRRSLSGFIIADVSGKKETLCINFGGCGPVITFALVGNWNNTSLEAMVLQAVLFLGGGGDVTKCSVNSVMLLELRGQRKGH